MNSALEDAVVLDAAAAVAGGNAAAVPAQFNSLRHAETRALVDLDERQWAAMGLLGAWHPLRLEQLNHRWLRCGHMISQLSLRALQGLQGAAGLPLRLENDIYPWRRCGVHARQLSFC